MDNLIGYWRGLGLRRQAMFLVSTIVLVLVVGWMARLVNAPTYSLLYSGLEPASAGELMQALDQQGAQYQIRGNAIYVRSTERDQLRFTMASQGLPMASSQGYELLDNLTGFGTTAQMFDAAYWRAKEGELARTIQSNTYVASARVHIANTRDRPFREANALTASVTALATSGVVSAEHAQAMRYLVGSAVAGLDPDNVSIIDGRNGDVVLAAGETAADQETANRASDLRQNVLRLLEARVGAGGAVVEINVDVDTNIEKIVERKFDPNGRVQISSQIEETTSSASNKGGGAVTVASNLPEGGGGQGDTSSDQKNTSRETANFEVSETQREVEIGPGKVRRISTAVLVDGLMVVDSDTGEEVWQPRSDEELATLRQLVASAVGFDEARGDVLTISSLQLNRPQIVDSTPETSLVQALGLDVMRILQLAVLATVVLVLGLFVVRPIIRQGVVAAQLPSPPTREVIGRSTEVASPEGSVAVAETAGSTEIGTNALPPPDTSPNAIISDDPVTRLRRLVEERQDEAVEILNNWMTDHEEKA